MKAYLGYYFIFSPPQSWDVRNKIDSLGNADSNMFCHSYVLVSRVWLQVGIISIIIMGLYFIFKGNKKC